MESKLFVIRYLIENQIKNNRVLCIVFQILAFWNSCNAMWPLSVCDTSIDLLTELFVILCASCPFLKLINFWLVEKKRKNKYGVAVIRRNCTYHQTTWNAYENSFAFSICSLNPIDSHSKYFGSSYRFFYQFNSTIVRVFSLILNIITSTKIPEENNNSSSLFFIVCRRIDKQIQSASEQYWWKNYEKVIWFCWPRR